MTRLLLRNKTHVSIGMPIYKGQKYLTKAIQSILSQDWQNYDVLMSVDNNDLGSAKICKKFLKDPRFKLYVHKTRLGWVKNISWLMQMQTGDYWYYHPQDDVVVGKYISKLVNYAKIHPEAAVIYSDIQCFGTLRKRLNQPPVIGKPFDREINLIRHYLPAVALRGLVRRDVILASGGMRDNNLNGFCADTTWMATLARFGELHRLPEPLYKKRYHQKNTHTGWLKHDSPWLEKAWAIHCRDMFLETIPVADTINEKYKIFKSTLYRLLESHVSQVYINSANWTKFKKAKYIAKFIYLLIFSNS